MSDNLTQVEQNIDLSINPNAGIGEIKALDHNNVLKEVLKKAGKYSGLPFIGVSETDFGNVQTGYLVWNNYPMNYTKNFTLTISRKTVDFNDFLLIISKLNAGDIIKYKDYSGRSVFLEFISYTPLKDGGNSGNDVINVVVKGFQDSVNYIYSDTDEEMCFLEFYPSINNKKEEKITIDTVEYTYRKNSENGSLTNPSKFDVAEYGIRKITEDGETFDVITSLVYNNGPKEDINSWVIISEVIIN